MLSRAACADFSTSRQTNVYSLPWPKQPLAKLGDQIFRGDQIRLRVTLSYFIDPNPGERGYSSRYRYVVAAKGLGYRPPRGAQLGRRQIPGMRKARWQGRLAGRPRLV